MQKSVTKQGVLDLDTMYGNRVKVNKMCDHLWDNWESVYVPRTRCTYYVRRCMMCNEKEQCNNIDDL